METLHQLVHLKVILEETDQLLEITLQVVVVEQLLQEHVVHPLLQEEMVEQEKQVVLLGHR